MKRKLAIAAFAIIAASSVAQDTPRSYKTDGLLNGHAWVRMNDSNRAWYVTGFEEGAIRASVADTDFECDCTAGRIADGVTAFYAEKKYRALPVVMAWRLFVMRAKGATPETIEAEAERLMKTLGKR